MKTITVKKGKRLPKLPKGFHYVELDYDWEEDGNNRVYGILKIPSKRDKLKDSLRACCRAASCDGSEPDDAALEVFVETLLSFLER